MDKQMIVAILMTLGAATGAAAADMLPLKQGIYVPAIQPCKGASNGQILNYWGGKHSFGAAQAECTIVKLAHKGNVYTINDTCRDIQSGGTIDGGPTKVTISSQTAFVRDEVKYRYCGAKVEF